MAGLGPAIHVVVSLNGTLDVDGRDKTGHDGCKYYWLRRSDSEFLLLRRRHLGVGGLRRVRLRRRVGGGLVHALDLGAFALEPGKISDPVKSQFGWHVIKVEEKRSRKAPDFEQVKGQIETYVTRKAQAEYVAKLRETAKVERMDQPSEAKADAKPADSKMAPAKK